MSKQYNNFSTALTNYLLHYLPNESGVSSNTILSYRDTFKLWIMYAHQEKNIKPDKITISLFTKDTVTHFLEWLEKTRNCSVTTRNTRLAALHAFAKYLQYQYPEFLNYANTILSIKKKKNVPKAVGFLDIEEVKEILKVAKENSLRDCTIVSVLYDTGCRVQELCDLRKEDIRLYAPYTITVTGKGSKKRIIPIQEDLAKLLKTYLSTNQNREPYLFVNKYHNKITREGITYILKKYVILAKKHMPTKYIINVTPHILRHSKSMHLLQAGVDLLYIRDFLGHVDLKTTEIYARIDSKMKREALLKTHSIVGDIGDEASWKKDSNVLSWLNGLK